MNLNRFHLPESAIAAIREGMAQLGIPLTTPEMSAETIKKFCSVLQSINVAHVEGSYDGSGDSGNMQYRFRIDTPRRNPGNNPPSTQSQFFDEREIKRRLTEGPTPITTPDAVDEFTDAMFNLLPGGWEIDEGSYGDINVDTMTTEIIVQHHERYTDIHSSTERY